VKANTQCDIEHLKHKHAPFMNEKALKYLNAVDNAAQYPGARIDADFGHSSCISIQLHWPWNQ
jgi:hypothetical protein